MLATSPAKLKLTDRLKSLLYNMPGVEPVPFNVDEPLPGTVRYGQVVAVPRFTGDESVGGWRPDALRMNARPLVWALVDDPRDESAKPYLTGMVARFRKLIEGTDPAEARPLCHVDDERAVYFPVTIDGFPVRVIMSWSTCDGAYFVSLDTVLGTAVG
jgi:hypothetical protein